MALCKTVLQYCSTHSTFSETCRVQNAQGQSFHYQPLLQALQPQERQPRDLLRRRHHVLLECFILQDQEQQAEQAARLIFSGILTSVLNVIKILALVQKTHTTRIFNLLGQGDLCYNRQDEPLAVFGDYQTQLWLTNAG